MNHHSPIFQSQIYRPHPPPRQESYPPYTPSNLSHTSSPVTAMGTPANTGKRTAAASVGDLPGPSRYGDRKQSVDSTFNPDDSSGKKKRVSLSCAQCKSYYPPALSLAPLNAMFELIARRQAKTKSKRLSEFVVDTIIRLLVRERLLTLTV